MPAAWHQGYATEALEKVITYAFAELPLLSLVSVTSAGLAGFVEEGNRAKVHIQK